jgi:hypothetical protein
MAKYIFCLLVFLSLNATVLSNEISVTYDIDTAYQGNSSLPAELSPNSSSIIAASSMQYGGGLSLSNWSYLEDSGQWVFGGWAQGSPIYQAPNIQFSITAKQAFIPSTLTYTFFSGNWSDVWIGPYVLETWASTDNFTTATKVQRHGLVITKPWLNTTNIFTDDLSILGLVDEGQTLSIRFVTIPAHDGPEAPAGFMKKYSNNTDVIFTANTVPEPSIIMLLSLGLAGFLLYKRFATDSRK